MRPFHLSSLLFAVALATYFTEHVSTIEDVVFGLIGAAYLAIAFVTARLLAGRCERLEHDHATAIREHTERFHDWHSRMDRSDQRALTVSAALDVCLSTLQALQSHPDPTVRNASAALLVRCILDGETNGEQ